MRKGTLNDEDGNVTHRIIYVGATIAELAEIFRYAAKTIRTKLAPLVPSGRIGNLPLYRLAEAAKHLVKADYDDPETVDRILSMNAKDLPIALQKAYWDGKNTELTYRERIADLWNSQTVVEVAGEAFKTMRLSLILLTDAVERESKLDEAQRDIITRLVNSTLEDLQRKLVDGFNERRERTLRKQIASGEADDAEGL